MQRLACRLLCAMLVPLAACSGRAAEPITPVLLTTFTNPSPAVDDYFGWSVAAVGNDHVVIAAYADDTGANNTGAAYLYSTTGRLLTTFTNPTPAINDNFGYSVTAVGTDRVLIGARQDGTGASAAGAAYMFSTNGELLTTFTNPTPTAGDLFGHSVAAVGTDTVLIGAFLDNTGASDAGAAYLFSTNGTLITTFTNPTPVSGDWFGFSIAGVGADRVLIGAYRDSTTADKAGAAYLFSTNGMLLSTFTNPTPSTTEYFGWSVTAVGIEWLLIGEPYDDAASPGAGAAHLFSTNGASMTTLVNPTSNGGDYVGGSVAAVGNDQVLIGAYQVDTAAGDAGAAYLFSTDGVLLTTITNPTPASSDYFGYSLTGVGSDRVLIGAYHDDTGTNNTGAVYLFLLEKNFPALDVTHSNSQYSVTWVTDEPSLILQQSDAPGSLAVWTDTPELAVTNGLTNLVQQTVPAGVTNRFYRLRRP